MTKGALIAALGFIAALCLAISTEWIGIAWSERPLFSAVQPQGIVYDGFGPYQLALVQQGHTLSTRYLIRIAKVQEPSYGYALNCPEIDVDPGRPPISKVSWTAGGVEIDFDSGNRLFVPKARFTGGR